MLIKSIEIKNFKRLKETKIYLSEKQSIFVGANNSGKTSAIQAISKFLSRESKFSVYDFTISNWLRLNEIFKDLMSKVGNGNVEEEEATLISELKKEATELFPTLKIVLKIDEDELYHVQKLIPTLDADISEVAVYYRFEPESYEELFKRYIAHRSAVDSLISIQEESGDDVFEHLWPKDFKHFLTDNQILTSLFTVNAYQANANDNETEYPFDSSTRIIGNPLSGIVQVDMINAQRGLSDDGHDSIGGKSQSNSLESLSSQFTKYYKRVIDPDKSPTEDDIGIIKANYNATKSFKSQLESSLSGIIKGLYDLGYPGFGSPSIQVAPTVNMINTIQDESSILFNTHPTDEENIEFYLPEHHNGLGFQNLISMFFKLTYFKAVRLREGKRVAFEEERLKIEPLHLILIEEPEAHLHAQAQKVFIDKAFEILDTGNESLKTQLVISTHSSHLTHNVSFNDLLYFKRKTLGDNDVPQTEVVSLNRVFGKDESENLRFVEQYLKIYDHDLFFADGVILIEGAGERILLPKFIKDSCPNLQSKYITLLEIGGSHSHRLFPLLKKLERPTLIITDIDSVKRKTSEDKNGKETITYPKVHVTKGETCFTSNSTIKKWKGRTDTAPSLIRDILKWNNEDKIDGLLRIAFQFENFSGIEGGFAFARTFEDSIAMTNIEFFSEMVDPVALCKKIKNSIMKNGEGINEQLSKELFIAINSNSEKSNFALDILFYANQNGNTLIAPHYIIEGLYWLEKMLSLEAAEKGGIDD